MALRVRAAKSETRKGCSGRAERKVVGVLALVDTMRHEAQHASHLCRHASTFALKALRCWPAVWRCGGGSHLEKDREAREQVVRELLPLRLHGRRREPVLRLLRHQGVTKLATHRGKYTTHRFNASGCRGRYPAAQVHDEIQPNAARTLANPIARRPNISSSHRETPVI